MKAKSGHNQALRVITLVFAAFLSLKAIPADPALTPEQLSQEIGKRVLDVEEFRFIRQESQKLGVHAYLFGGTAAGFAHYVKWDALRNQGNTRYQPDRFDYDYSNIYRSNQDLDIVIDGSPAQAKELEARLREKFPHLQGSKNAWEVRPLRSSAGTKEALLGNPDFLNQHTDSNSTGMIEITAPENKGSIIKDLKDMSAATPHFLKDVAEGKLHFYFSPTHWDTARAKRGDNPPILYVDGRPACFPD